MMTVNSILWSLLLPRWSRGGATSSSLTDGYTLLLPVPGDLPVFTRLALDVCRLQSNSHRRKALVIADLPSAAVRDLVDDAMSDFPDLEYVEPPPHLRRLLGRLNDPGRYHALQLIEGTKRAASTHVILHDADAILLDREFLDTHYLEAVRTGAAALGVHALWDETLRRHRPDLVATWEMCARTDWVKSVPPHRHLAHKQPVHGEPHVLDTTVYAQLQTAPHQLVLHGAESQFIHFNYVVSTFRAYQSAHQAQAPFADTNFRLLFIRLLTDSLGGADHPALPSLDALALGLTPSKAATVTYPAPSPEVRGQYGEFRAKLLRGVSAIYGGRSLIVAQLASGLREFDLAYR